MAIVFDWSDERRERFKVLYRAGLSFAAIAAQMGCSRNAAIGKAHRMKLSVREPAATLEKKIAKRIAPVPPAPKPTPTVIKTPRAPLQPPTGHACEINDLTDRSCRFPLWAHSEPLAFDRRLYCGTPEADVYADKPYCRYHSQLCNPERQ